MAKYYSSTFGKISGKHGNAVAVIRKDGSTYLRIHKAASNPRTDKQQAHRAKFALTSRSLAPFNHIFKATMGITNGISIARSHAFKNAIVEDNSRFIMNYEKLMFSFGTLEKLSNASTTLNEGVITIKWDFKKMYNSHKNDSVNIVVFNKEVSQALHIDNVAKRSDKAAMIDIHEAWANSELYIWAYVTRHNKISDSVFVGKCGGVDDWIDCGDNQDIEVDGYACPCNDNSSTDDNSICIEKEKVCVVDTQSSSKNNANIRTKDVVKSPESDCNIGAFGADPQGVVPKELYYKHQAYILSSRPKLQL